VKAFTAPQGKKIVDMMVDNAKKRESNAKLLESIEESLQLQLGIARHKSESCQTITKLVEVEG